MNSPHILPLALGLVIFSFLVTSVLVVPFINLLYKIKFLRKKEGDKRNRESLFDKLHDKKAGTPVGGGILLIVVVSVLFAIIFHLVTNLGVFIQSSFKLNNELIIIFFTFISFGLLGLLDDVIKIFGKPKPGNLGSIFGLSKSAKFILQLGLAMATAALIHFMLGIQILHIPVLDIVIDLGIFYIPFAAFVIVFFANAFNFTDGLDGLASGLLVIYLFAYVIIAVSSLDTPLFIFTSIWIGSLMAFLYFNVWPARIFMGDAGALSFGAMIAVIGLILGNVTTLFVIGGMFVIEAASSLIQIIGWKVLKRKIFP
ncbi:MAG: Phospho-N-acetylmuramoyl-pentapeptide-transferase, partial [Candidatus Woesebacteria bacterium GW2011_GWB1_38_5b]